MAFVQQKSAWRKKRSADKLPDLKERKRRIINALLKVRKVVMNIVSNEERKTTFDTKCVMRSE